MRSNYLDKRYWKVGFAGVRGALTHLRNTKTISGLKRIKVGAYQGTVYNLFMQATKTKGNPTTYNLVRAFEDYVLSIDKEIDQKTYPPRQNKTFGRQDIRKLSEAPKYITAFLQQLKKSKLTIEQKRAMIKCFGDFRRNAEKSVRKTMLNPFASKEEVMEGIWNTGGAFAATAAELMSIAHNIPKEKTQELKTTFQIMSTALQLRDDFRDCTHDFGTVQNSIISIALNHPSELAEIERLKQKDVPRDWARKRLPKTMQESDKLFEQYMKQLPNTEFEKRILTISRNLYYMN